MCLNLAASNISVVRAYNNGQSSYRFNYCPLQIGWGGKVMCFCRWVGNSKSFGKIIGMAMWDCHVVIQTNAKLFHLEQFVNIWYPSGQAKFGQGNLLYIIQWENVIEFTIEMNIQTISIPYHKHWYSDLWLVLNCKGHYNPVQVCEAGPSGGGKVGDCRNNLSGNIPRLPMYGQVHLVWWT